MPGRSWKGHAAKVCERCGRPLQATQECACAGEAPKPVPVSERFLGVGGVTAHVDDRALTGAVVIRDEGVFLFIERCEEKPSLALGLVNAVLDRVSGVLGGVFEHVAGAGGEASPPAGVKPREDYQAFYDRALHDAPEIARSRWCLPLARGAVRLATFHGGGLLELSTPGRALELWAGFEERGARPFMEACGYTVRQQGAPVGKRLVLAATAALALWALAREVVDLQQTKEWAGPKVAAAAASAVDAKGEISVVMVRDGARFYVIDGREVPESRLSWAAKAWFHYREVAMVLLLGLVAAGLGLWATLSKLR